MHLSVKMVVKLHSVADEIQKIFAKKNEHLERIFNILNGCLYNNWELLDFNK